MEEKSQYSVLFLCTGNSVRSIMAECALRRWGHGRFVAYSAGSQPIGQVDPLVIDLLSRLNYAPDQEQLRSKSWDEFRANGAPELDFVFSLSEDIDPAAVPAFPGQPVVAQWGIEDPRGFVGSDEKKFRLYKRVYLEVENRTKLFASLRMEGLTNLTLKTRLDEIGTSQINEPVGA